MLTPELRHASALPDLPTYLTCPAFAVLCPPSVSCSRLIGPRSYPCLCPAPSTPAKRPKWPSEPALIARLLPIPFDAVAWHHPTTLDAESLRCRAGGDIRFDTSYSVHSRLNLVRSGGLMSHRALALLSSAALIALGCFPVAAQ